MNRVLAGLVLAALFGPACAPGSQAAAPPPAPRTFTGTIGAAAYRIEVPARWNRTLVLYSHGYVAPGSANPAVAAPGPDASTWLAAHGYAAAGTSYGSTGWALEDAFKDQVAVLDVFDRKVGKPARTIAWGHSLGGIITAGLVQLNPTRFAGALPMCGVVAGGVGSWNAGLDSAFAFKTLLAPTSALAVVRVADPVGNAVLAGQVLQQAAATPQGAARMALASALADVPGWFDPASPEPAPTDLATIVQNQGLWAGRVNFPYVFALRSELEKRAGGNPSWNVGVDYRRQLDLSIDKDEVAALYEAAGLDLAADLDRLNAAPRVAPDPAAVAYLTKNIVFDGKLPVPVLTMHTTGDGLVPVQDEQAYADVVKGAGQSALLRQVFVHRAGHCAFTAGETIQAFQALVHRLDTGAWDDAALAPVAMNAASSALGARFNELLTANFTPTPPAFSAYAPSAFPRPYDARSKPPG